jgi:hypothetical protein
MLRYNLLVKNRLIKAQEAGLLFPVHASASWRGEKRALFMCRPLNDALKLGKSAPEEKNKQIWYKLEEVMISFVEGRRMTENIIKQLNEPKFEHWEIKSRKPKPGLRAFGRFIEPDVFIATHVKYRHELGGMNSPQFENEKLKCEDHWNEAGLEKPFSALPDFRYEHYITDNAVQKIQVPK